MGNPSRGLGRWYAVLLALTVSPGTAAQTVDADPPRIETARHLYYDGDYLAAAAEAQRLLDVAPEDLAALELRTAAILFQVKRLIGQPDDSGRDLDTCETCPDLVTAFLEDVARGRAIAKRRLEENPDDHEALFALGKLDLNYIWMHLGPLGRRTGWTEYREARRSLDALLDLDPSHGRARVARAWIDYVVDTRVPWIFRWILGGGDRTGALRTMRETVVTQTDYYTQIEARFSLWDMLAREERFGEAVVVARQLAEHFPGNLDLAEFLADHALADERIAPNRGLN
jgi:tetratricopeptide (TPR) repeat protein